VRKGGTEAWSLFRKEPDRFDLVITDQIMPDLTGTDLAKRILKVRRETPVVLFTGYAEKVSENEARAMTPPMWRLTILTAILPVVLVSVVQMTVG
jgi:CheY-like chemotaxis protein